MSADDLPEPDRAEGAPHPREAPRVHGHDAAIADFRAAQEAGRVHSGWLIAGPEGIGKATLAYRLAGMLLSDEADPAPDHPDLRLIRARSHPRLFVLRRGPDASGAKLSAQITVDEARRMRAFFQMSAADGGRRVVIVDTADLLNPSAANAILKLLEEPPPGAVLFLLSHAPARLLPTIRSRCRMLRLNPLAPGALAAVLADAGIAAPPPDVLAVLAGGSAGAAVRLVAADGAALYADLVRLLSALPRIDRGVAAKLADSCAGPAQAGRLGLLTDLIDLFLARAARAGIDGEPQVQAATGEARLLARLAPDDRAARLWAERQAELPARLRQGRAVNLDPAALILDTLLRIEETARMTAASRGSPP